MWLATRTRPDISATLGILASQMVIRPKYVHSCLKQLWRYIVGTRELDMTSFEPNDVAFGELLSIFLFDSLKELRLVKGIAPILYSQQEDGFGRSS